MRQALPMILLLLNPLLLKAEEIPADFFPPITLDQPLPTTFETGQHLSLSGTTEDSNIITVNFSFIRSDSFQIDFWGFASGGRFVREAVFPHGAVGRYNLVVEANRDTDSAWILGRFEGLEITRGQGPVMLPRRYFPFVNLDRPLPTSITTGEELRVGGSVEGFPPPARLIFRFLSETGSQWDFHFLAEEGRFERTILLPQGAEEAYALVVYVGPGREAIPPIGFFPDFDITRGPEPVEIPKLFFDGLVLDEPLPVQWPVQAPVVFAGRARSFVREIRLVLGPPDSLEAPRILSPGVEEGRFAFPAKLKSRELGPINLTVVVRLDDGTLWPAGEYVIEGIDPPAADLEVGVLSLALLAGQEGKVPLLNRGNGTVEIETPRVEGPFAVERYPLVLEPGEAGEIVLSYSGAGDDQGLLTVLSDDPFRPRVAIALSGLERRDAASDLVHLRADAAGRIEAELDLREQDFVLALYSSPLEAPDPDAVYNVLLDGSSVRGKSTPAPRADRFDSLEYQARRVEQILARRLQQGGHRAGKPVRVQYEVGDRRSFNFPGEGDVPEQSIEARVVAVNERAVAFVQEDLREEEGNIGEEQIQTVIDQFAEDYPILVEAFGAPSDVDGDGRIALLFTHLIHDVGRVVTFSARAVAPARLGGDGNMTDLLWLSPVASERYRPLLAHYFQHLINFNQHVLVRRSIPEEIWLNEGLAHVARDLVVGQTRGNYGHVRSFLRQPAAAGLSTGIYTSAWRGAAYLFVRSLVDLLGEEVLLRLVQTGLVGRDNVEAATGENFADLMARWGAQLYISGTGQSGHSRFNYRISPLQTPQGRGFPPPASVTYRLGEEPPGLAVKPWGLQFLRVVGRGTASLSLQTEPQAGLGAVVLPVAKAAAAAPMDPDYFAGITFDPPLPVELATGEPLLLQGTTADSVELIHLEFVREDAGETDREFFFLLVDEGRFSRTVYFNHDEAGTYFLNAYVVNRKPTSFAGRFFPIHLTQGHGALQVPTGYFNRVRLDRPLPTSVDDGQRLHISGEVTDSEATAIEFALYALDEEGNLGAAADTTLSLPVEAGRFDGELHFDGIPGGRYRLAVRTGPAGDLTYVGAVVFFEILPSAATVAESGPEPAVFALYPNYPNPFNRGTVLSFSLPETQPAVELAVYDLLGQKLAVLVRGARGSGFHSVEWDGRDESGRDLASGSYLYRLQAGPYRAVGKLMLLR